MKNFKIEYVGWFIGIAGIIVSVIFHNQKTEYKNKNIQLGNDIGQIQQNAKYIINNNYYQNAPADVKRKMDAINTISSDAVSVIAEDHSINILRGVGIHSKKTELRASDHSQNIFEDTTFQGNKGSVNMNKIGQTGQVDVEDSSVTFKQGGSLIFRPSTKKEK